MPDISKYASLTNHKRVKILEIRKYCKQLYDSGYACEKVAEFTNFSVSSIHKMAHQDNWKLRRNMRKCLEKARVVNENAVIQMYKRGKTLDEISAGYGLKSRKTARDILRKHGITVKWSITFNKKTMSCAKMLYDSGVGIVGVARKIGVDPVVVRRNFENAGFKLRTQTEQNQIIAQRKFKSVRCFARAEFSQVVRTLSKYNYKYNKFHINPENKPIGKNYFVIDHIASLCSAYNYFRKTKDFSVIYLISHPANFQLLSTSENSRKSANSWLTRSELLTKVREYNLQYGCPYARFWDYKEYPIFSWVESLIGYYEGYDCGKTS